MEVTMPKGLMALQGRPAGEMNLVGGRLFLDFVNTVGARHNLPSHGTTVCDDKLKVYLDLLSWGLHVKLLSRAEAEVLLRKSGRLPREASALRRRAMRPRAPIHHL